MANPEHEALFRSGVEPWNKWRSANPRVSPDLSGADFSRRTNTKLKFANLDDCDLRGADLDFAYLKGTTLRGAKLQEARCRNTTFSDADLTGAHLERAHLSRANLFRATCCRVRFDAAKLDGASLVETNVEGAFFDGALVYGVSAWNLRGVPSTQRRLVITPEDQPVVEVDDIQVAQLVFLLIQHANLGKLINTVTERGVLLLGRFGGGGIEILRAVADRLREQHGYLPIILDFERPRDRDFTETVQTLVGLSRFVIVDLSGPSVPHELASTVRLFELPFVPILEQDRQPYSLFRDFLAKDWVLKLVEFSSPEDLLAKVHEHIVVPAEARVFRRQQLLAELFKRR